MSSRIITFSIIAIISIVAIIVLFFYNLLKAHKEWKEKIKTSPIDRMLKSKQSFIDHYVKMGYSEKSISFVYDKTQEFIKAKDLVLLPSDNIIVQYERQEDEWGWAIEEWFKQLNRQQPDRQRINELIAKHKGINFEYLIDLIDN